MNQMKPTCIWVHEHFPITLSPRPGQKLCIVPTCPKEASLGSVHIPTFLKNSYPAQDDTWDVPLTM